MSYIQNKLLEKHICRFNDGECNCDCYIAGITDYHNHIVEEVKEFRHRVRNLSVSSDFDIEFDDFISLLQDTNPKE